MRPVSRDEIRRLEEIAIKDFSIPSLLLMENAGRGISDVLCRDFVASRVCCFIGKGNNGGDGLVVARHLANHGFDVRVVLLETEANLKSDPLINFQIIKKMNIPVTFVDTKDPESSVFGACQSSDLLVDAIFGIGLRHWVDGFFEKAIQGIIRSKKTVISIDIPSGLDADTGQVHGVAVTANRTLTLGLPKKGLFVGDGPDHAGKIELVDIGLPKELLLSYLNERL